jgi:hypothetical protein
MKIKEFIKHITTFESVDSILDTCKNQSEKGFIYERLWDICIKLGFCNHFQKPDFIHLIGNMNNGNLKPLTTFTHYLNEKVVSGNSSGCSDISLFNQSDDTFTFITSKYPKSEDDITKQKSVSYYEIQNIISAIDDNKHIYPNFKIYLLVPDKKSVLEKVKNANKSSKHITKYMKEQNILDKNDLNKCFLRFKMDMLKHMNIGKMNYDEIYLSPKSNLYLRFHQELITQKTSTLIEEGYKSFLWGCKCRSGKTYMFGGLILKQFEIKQKLNVLIITPAPTETAPQFTDDLFNKFKEFESFKIHHIEGSKNIESLILDDSNIFVISKQLLQKYIDDKTIKNLNLDIIGFDENHFSGTTDLSKSILDSYSSKNTIKVYLTATYNKPLREWNISEECQMYWDIEDEQICKSILADVTNIDRLKEKHGDTCITSTIKFFTDKGLTLTDIFKPYENMPDLYLITTMFDSQRYNIIKDTIMGSKYGFCFEVLFALNKQKTKFQFEKEVKTILRFISGSNKEVDFKNGDKSMFSRILKICSDKESRTPFTQIWFLPSDHINEISKCLEHLMNEDNILKKYNVLCINRKNKELAKDIKEDITKHEKIAKAEGKEGLILLAGNMLTLGITLNMCDVVVLMNNTLSSDKVLQQMYRCMTEGFLKKFGFVIDLNISRILNTCVNYTIYKNDQSIEDKIKYMIENHLINIDVDMMEQKRLNSDSIVSKLMEIWKSDPINNFKSLLRNLENDYIEYDTSTQKIINKSFTSSLKDDKVNTTIEIKDEEDELQELPSGKEIIRDDRDEKEVKEEKEAKEIKISFTKDVLPYVIPLTVILTMKSANKDFVKMLKEIQENPKLLDLFDDMCLIWWNKKDLINIIKNIVSKYFDKNSNTYNISINFKMSLQSLIDSPKELLELINECLKPKIKEKQENGEVFTPMSEIEEELDKLDEHYKVNKKSIFTELYFKWFDPAVGMGNFMVAVYLRLMIGLKSQMPNEKDRKKHIIENMLYMSELNKKNCHVIKQIFNVNNEYNLKLHEGDTLVLNITDKWNLQLHSFDVVLGNPPYNKGGIRSHTGKQLGEKNETIWTKFIEQAFQLLKPDGFIVFINPLSWLKKSHSLHNVMLEKHIVWMKLWDNSQSKSSINADIPISLYILKNTQNTILKKTTEITSVLKRRNLTNKSSEYLNSKYSIPLAYHSIFNKLINFIETKKLKLDYNTKTIKSSGTKAKIPSNYKKEDMWAIDTYTIKEGLMVKKATEEHPDMKKRKLIIANKASFTGAFIDEGILNLTGNHKFYILGDKLELILKLLDFKIMNIIGHYTKYGQDFLDNEAFTYIPDIRKLGITDITESEFYKLLELTTDEIKSLKYTDEEIKINDSNNEDTKVEPNEQTTKRTKKKVDDPEVKQKNKKTKTIEEHNKSIDNYESMTNSMLMQLCRDRKIKGFSGKKKELLIELLKK